MKTQNCLNKNDLELIFMIVNFGFGSKVIKIAKKNGISGGTIFLGRGTIKNQLLEILGLNDSRKEIVVLIADKTLAYQALGILNKELAFHKPNHGIAFTISVSNLFGSKRYQCSNLKKAGDTHLLHPKEKGGKENIMYQAIFTIVDRGNAEIVIDAANKGGARGGTIINARGSGIHETHTLFSMAIEPEKEMVLIISKYDKIDSIVSSIREHIQIDEPGKGIIFILDVNKTYGLYLE